MQRRKKESERDVDVQLPDAFEHADENFFLVKTKRNAKKKKKRFRIENELDFRSNSNSIVLNREQFECHSYSQQNQNLDCRQTSLVLNSYRINLPLRHLQRKIVR